MTKLIFLGVGNGVTENLYNTCFAIQNKHGEFLIDAGSSIEIVKRLRMANINYRRINDIFISHSHTDHILGLIWLIKLFYSDLGDGIKEDKVKIYCNDVVYESIKGIASYCLPKKLLDIAYNKIEFVILNDGDKHIINDIEYTFFDLQAKGTKQFGFEFIDNGIKFVFLGDEKVKPSIYPRIKNSDYVTHEAFCLESEENIFHANEKNHSTVKNASEIMNELKVNNLILYHTEETHGQDRKRLYTEEGQKYFNGNIIVPDDLETIELTKKLHL